MHVIRSQNINDAFFEGAHQLMIHGEKAESRNGPVITARDPFVTIYENPKQRLLFWPDRDANPFFHLFESLWMLAGRNDVAGIAAFNAQMRDYSDDGISFHGAYGFRWRAWFGFDQIKTVIDQLKKDPTSRRAVIGMWDPKLDPRVADQGGKDVPCNLAITFRVVNGELDMCVFNRSNDLIWGAYGANVVHFSMLQQLIAEALSVGVGNYTQFSANTHVYERHWDLATKASRMSFGADLAEDHFTIDYDAMKTPVLLLPGEDPVLFMQDCNDFISRAADGIMNPSTAYYSTVFFNDIVKPMYRSWEHYNAARECPKDRPSRGVYLKEAKGFITSLAADKVDWAVAGIQWLDRRFK
jgi:hypothetical protein